MNVALFQHSLSNRLRNLTTSSVIFAIQFWNRKLLGEESWSVLSFSTNKLQLKIPNLNLCNQFMITMKKIKKHQQFGEITFFIRESKIRSQSQASPSGNKRKGKRQKHKLINLRHRRKSRSKKRKNGIVPNFRRFKFIRNPVSVVDKQRQVVS